VKALTFHGPEEIRVETRDDPGCLEPGDAVVEVTLAAICGSDMHVYHARETGLDCGTVMGHEFVGRVVEVGKDVRELSVGDVVLSPFTTSCGRCFFCRSGLTARCERGQLYGWVEKGHGLHGAQAEYVRVPLAESTLCKVPEGVSQDEALLLGDVLPTGWYCASRAGIEPGGTYAVVGCGPVGLMAVLAATELGAERLYAIDSVPERLELARRFGATPIDFRHEDPSARLREATEGRGADAVLEVVGSAEAGRAAYDLVRPGGTLSVVGVHTADHLPFSPAEAYDKNLTFRVGRCPARHLIDRLIPLVRSGKHDPAAIISHRLGLRDGPEAYRLFDERREGCVKIVLEP
jgi:threonine dehydrogenase-like Zn-dependent dehydrogenase